MSLPLGIATFTLGAAVYWIGSQGFAPDADLRRPPWVSRLGLALGALGLAVLTSSQRARGVSWSISSICFSLIAIVYTAWVLRDNLRR